MSGSREHNNLPGDRAHLIGGEGREFRLRAASVGGSFYFSSPNPTAHRRGIVSELAVLRNAGVDLHACREVVHMWESPVNSNGAAKSRPVAPIVFETEDTFVLRSSR